jgi:hypothetical protein
MEKSEKFEITYNSIGDRERREIESIRNRYIGLSDSDDKRTRLRRLDFLVRRLPIFISVAICVIGLLVFGLGLALVLEFQDTVLGSIIGTAGLLIMIAAYPIYKGIYIFQRRRYAGPILSLSDELLNS